MIPNRANSYDNFRYPEFYYNSAREALHDFVKNLFNIYGIKDMVMPGYIGWSPKEGSGLFDSVKNIAGLSIQYYKLDQTLSVDVKSFIRLLDIKTSRCIVLLVNYFGFRDTEYETLVQFAHSRGHIVIEDNAHGFFTYHFDRRTRVDATFFSLHKQFPFERGGILKIHKPEFLRLELIGSQILPYDMNPYVYNIEAISTKRISNFKLLSHLIESMTNTTDINPLFLDEKLDNVVPQSFPILINKADRNQIYYKLNDCGFGVVSLYHTLIDDLQRAEFNDAQSVSKRILNLPIHQDVDTDQYVSMIEELNKLCKAYE